MSEPLTPLQKIAKAFPDWVGTGIGYLQYKTFRNSEDYELLQEIDGIKLWRNPRNYHPVFETSDEEGRSIYFSGVMPG